MVIFAFSGRKQQERSKIVSIIETFCFPFYSEVFKYYYEC